jgi:hypothetical protein
MTSYDHKLPGVSPTPQLNYLVGFIFCFEDQSERLSLQVYEFSRLYNFNRPRREVLNILEVQSDANDAPLAGQEDTAV